MVIGGHGVTLGLAAALILTEVSSTYVLAVVIGCWSVFAWGLNPPVQSSILAAAGSESGMTAFTMNISGLYLGTGVAAARGGVLIDAFGVLYVPLTATALMH